jgi:hypothetical protein
MRTALLVEVPIAVGKRRTRRRLRKGEESRSADKLCTGDHDSMIPRRSDTKTSLSVRALQVGAGSQGSFQPVEQALVGSLGHHGLDTPV